MDLITLPPIGFEQLTISTTAVPFTESAYTNRGTTGTSIARTKFAKLARVTVDAQGIRYRVDGTAPTAAIGHAVAAGATIDIEGFDAIRNFRAIRSGGSDATLNVTFFGE